MLDSDDEIFGMSNRFFCPWQRIFEKESPVSDLEALLLCPYIRDILLQIANQCGEALLILLL